MAPRYTAPGRFAAMVDDYGSYVKDMGVLELPPGYNVQRQIERNALMRQLQFYWWVLAAVAAGLAFAAVRIWRTFTRRSVRTGAASVG